MSWDGNAIIPPAAWSNPLGVRRHPTATPYILTPSFESYTTAVLHTTVAIRTYWAQTSTRTTRNTFRGRTHLVCFLNSHEAPVKQLGGADRVTATVLDKKRNWSELYLRQVNTAGPLYVIKCFQKY
jgi:hypothetical protein